MAQKRAGRLPRGSTPHPTAERGATSSFRNGSASVASVGNAPRRETIRYWCPACGIRALDFTHKPHRDGGWGVFVHCFGCSGGLNEVHVATGIPKSRLLTWPPPDEVGPRDHAWRSDAGGAWEPGPTEEQVRGYHKNLLSNPAVLRYLIEERGVCPGHIDRYELGYDSAANAIAFPIRDARGKLVNLKRRYLDPAANPKSRGMRGEGRSHLYPIDRLHGDGPLVLCEGEITAHVLNRYGFRAITSTGGKNWKPEWTALVAGQQVAVFYDADAELAAEHRAAEFRAAGVDAWAARLSHAGFSGTTDPDDVLVKHGWSANQLRRLIRKPRTPRRFLHERRSA